MFKLVKENLIVNVNPECIYNGRNKNISFEFEFIDAYSKCVLFTVKFDQPTLIHLSRSILNIVPEIFNTDTANNIGIRVTTICSTINHMFKNILTLVRENNTLVVSFMNHHIVSKMNRKEYKFILNNFEEINNFHQVVSRCCFTKFSNGKFY